MILHLMNMLYILLCLRKCSADHILSSAISSTLGIIFTKVKRGDLQVPKGERNSEKTYSRQVADEMGQ